MVAPGDNSDLRLALDRLLALLAARGCTDAESFQVHLAVEAARLAAEKRRDPGDAGAA